jgi:hypothetical protein
LARSGENSRHDAGGLRGKTMNALRTATTGEIRYEVSYCPKKHGDAIRADDETAWPGDYCLCMNFTDFRAAEKFAIEKAQDDWFGMTQLRRFVCENPKYDWWDQTGIWEIEPDCEPGSTNPDKAEG